MAYHYTDKSRESDPHAQPDVEVLRSGYCECDMCGETYQHEPGGGQPTPEKCECGNDLACTPHRIGWFAAYGFPGCLWDSDPVGPFDTEAEALTEARKAAGFDTVHCRGCGRVGEACSLDPCSGVMADRNA